MGHNQGYPLLESRGTICTMIIGHSVHNPGRQMLNKQLKVLRPGIKSDTKN